MSFQIVNKQGVQALDPNQLISALSGSSVISGLEVSTSSGMAVTIASGRAYVGGAPKEVSGTNVTLSSGGSLPRKDIIWVNSDGVLQVSSGAPEEKDPTNANRFNLAVPSPPSLAGIVSTVIAEVFIDANQTSLTSADIRDRRVIIIGQGGQTEEYDNGDSGTSLEVYWNNGRSQKVTLTDNCALTFSAPSAIGRYDLRIIQGTGGGHDITSVPAIFPDGQPEWTQGAAGDEIILTVRYDGQKYVAFDSGYYEVS